MPPPAHRLCRGGKEVVLWIRKKERVLRYLKEKTTSCTQKAPKKGTDLPRKHGGSEGKISSIFSPEAERGEGRFVSSEVEEGRKGRIMPDWLFRKEKRDVVIRRFEGTVFFSLREKKKEKERAENEGGGGLCSIFRRGGKSAIEMSGLPEGSEKEGTSRLLQEGRGENIGGKNERSS